MERIGPLLEQMGITRIANVTGLDRIGIPVVMVTRPNSRSVSVSQGKGLDLDSAKASALMEAIETWHAESMTLPLIYGAYGDLCDQFDICDPNSLQQVQSSYFNGATRILWVEGTNLVGARKIWVPFEMVHTDYTVPAPAGHGCFHSSTNGLASGNTRIEAQNHAICEVIERDATTLLHHLSATDRAERQLDIKTIDDHECQKLLRTLSAADLDITLWDTTTDIGVPSYYGILTNTNAANPEHIGIGAGCHPSNAIALSRTITEAVQTRLTYISGARDDLLTAEFNDQGVKHKYRLAKEFIAQNTYTHSYNSVSGYCSNSLSEDAAWLIGRLKSVGLEQVISVDLTKPDIGIPVVRIIIPGLEAPHDDDDYVPGMRAEAVK